MKKIAALIVLFHLFSCSRSRIGYVNIQSVFNGFTYKQQLEKELKTVSEKKKFILDSLETNLKILGRKIKLEKHNKVLIAEYETMRELFIDKRTVFREDEETMVRHYDEKVLSQMNSYVKEYGEKEKYDVIYGATSSGNVMYADSTLDLTYEVIAYINEKYHGEK